MKLYLTTLNTTLGLGLRAAAAAALAITVTACGTSPMAPSAAPATGLVSDASTAAKAPSGPGQFDGLWYQDPVVVIPQADGGVGNVWTRIALTQKGSTITGEARRFINTWDVNGTPVFVNFDLGSPGKITGTATASAISIVVRDFTETKQTFSLSLSISATGQHLDATGGSGNSLSISAFRR